MKDVHSKTFLWQARPWESQKKNVKGSGEGAMEMGVQVYIQCNPLQLLCDQGSVQTTAACCVIVWERERRSWGVNVEKSTIRHMEGLGTNTFCKSIEEAPAKGVRELMPCGLFIQEPIPCFLEGIQCSRQLGLVDQNYCTQKSVHEAREMDMLYKHENLSLIPNTHIKNCLVWGVLVNPLKQRHGNPWGLLAKKARLIGEFWAGETVLKSCKWHLRRNTNQGGPRTHPHAYTCMNKCKEKKQPQTELSLTGYVSAMQKLVLKT